MLSVRDLHVGYDGTRVLQGLDLEVRSGEVTAIIGSNGVGKTTLLQTIAGLLVPRSGSITFRGVDIAGRSCHDIVQRGLILVPEGRRLFQRMTVRHNVELGAFSARARNQLQERLAYVFDLFPVLRERSSQLAGTLSGGQQQLCAIARGLMAVPELLMLDEISLGLAPLAVKKVYEAMRAIRERGVALIIVEQNVRHALSFADRGYVIRGGRVVLSGTGRELAGNPEILRAYMGLAHAEGHFQ